MQGQTAVRGVALPTLVELFRSQVRRTPDAPAVICGHVTLSYAELADRSNRLARQLVANGAGPEQVVAVALPRSEELVVALLAVLTSGSAYLPIDLSHPLERVLFMLGDARPMCVVTTSDTELSSSGRGPAGMLLLDDADLLADLAQRSGSGLTDLERSAPLAPANAAYVSYTSGSTGTPKAVLIEHSGLADYLDWARHAYPSLAGVSLWHCSATFDMTVTALWATLVSGGAVVVLDSLTDDDTGDENDAVRHQSDRNPVPVSCTFLKATPSHLPVLESLPDGFSPTGELMLGGEALVAATLAQWRERHPAATVINVYGPTEVTVNCCEHVIEPGEVLSPGVVPLGRAMHRTTLHVLDASLKPMPPGVVGELYVSCPGLARGYRHQPSMSAVRFVADPYGDPGARMYRTGDLAKWGARGLLEFAGRADDQVKLRGFRIELGEVESTLAEHPGVVRAAATIREDRPGDQRLVAYVTVRPQPEGSLADLVTELREHAAALLPSFMVPSAFVVLDSLPLSPNGKLQRSVLPIPDQHVAEAVRAPRSEDEKRLCELFAEVLGVTDVGIDDGFFELGGHSLLGTRLISRIRTTLDCELRLRDLFAFPTVAELAQRLTRVSKAAAPLVSRVRPARVPLSPAQQRLWFLYRLGDAHGMYNISRVVRLKGHLDRDALQTAIADVVGRHDSLRMVIDDVEGTPYQRILDVSASRPGVHFVDSDEAGLPDLLRTAVRHAFELSSEPAFSITVVSISADEHVVLLLSHHLAADGGSFGPLLSDLSIAYAARYAGRSPAWPPLPLQYADYALWQRDSLGDERDPQSTAARQLAFWRETLDGLPTAIELPLDRPRPATASHSGDSIAFELDATVHQGIIDLAKRTGSTVFMVMHAAIAVLLTRLGAGTDIPIGTAVAGRGDERLDGLVGFFVNTLVLRVDCAGEPSFAGLLARIRQTEIAALEHQDVPFERVVEAVNPARSLAHHPVYQVMLTFQAEARDGLDMPGLSTYVHGADPAGAGVAKFDLAFDVREFHDAGGIEASLEYAQDLFDRGTAEAFAQRFTQILTAVIADSDQPIGELDILVPGERGNVLHAWNDTAHPLAPSTLPELFADVVRRAPDAPAVLHDGVGLTYAELDARSNRLARLLIARGVGPERFVAVMIDKSPELVVALLAVVKAGGGYLPLDPTYPASRIAGMLADVGPELTLTTTSLVRHVPDDGRCLTLDDPQLVVAVGAQASDEVTNEDRTQPLRPANPAFVIFTSGSTGRPKGVVVEHRSLNGYLAWSRQAYPGVAGHTLVHSPVSFDLTVTGLFATLTAGGCAQLIDLDDGTTEGTDAPRPTFVKATPSHLPLLTALPPAFSPSEQLVLGGESLMGEVLDEWRSLHPGVTVVNEYGPTETTVGCMEQRIEPGEPVEPGVVTIGHPIWNTQVLVLDSAMRPLPVGVIGELYIGGDLLTRGYCAQPGLTSTRFVANPHGDRGSRIYRSGDLARWRADGRLEFAGRSDNQVKLRGYRIELGEIEAVIGAHQDVRHVAVIVREDQAGDRRLVAYVVAGPDGIQTQELTAYAVSRLPEYMVPAAVVVLDVLPVTANLKLDRRALPVPEYATDLTGTSPQTPQEEILCGLFAEVLKLPRVGTADNFFELGGHSLLATRLVSRVRATLDAELSLRSVFEAPTVAELATRLALAGRARLPVRRLTERPERPPLSYAQRRLWFLFHLEGPSATYNVPLAVRLTGRLDLLVLEAALGDVIQRHEALRTIYPDQDGEPFQQVLPACACDPGLSVVTTDERSLPSALDNFTRHPFDLRSDAPMRVTVFTLSPETHVLLFVVHHIAMDGASEAPMARDLSKAYAARLRGVEPQWDPMPCQYADYAIWQHKMLGAADDPASALHEGLGFWTDTLSGAPELVALTTDRPRPAVSSFEGDIWEFELGPGLHQAVAALARGTGTTLFMVIQAVLATLLSRLGAGSDVPIGTPVAGRTEAGVDELIGSFVNTLVLRTDVSGDPTLRELLVRVRETDLAAYGHQDVPFDLVVEAVNPQRALGHHPLFQVLLVLQNTEAPAFDLPGLAGEPVPVDPRVAKFDLSFGFTDIGSSSAEPAGMMGKIEYDRDLFDPSTIKALASRLMRLLADAVADPDRPLGRFAILSNDEQRVLMQASCGTPTDVAGVADATIADLFEAQASLTPQALAVTGETSLTYAELDRQANRLAHRLMESGVAPQDRVIVLLDRSAQVVVASLAVAKANACYVPLHGDYPAQRVRELREQTGATVLLTDKAMRDKSDPDPDSGVRMLVVDDASELGATADGSPADRSPGVGGSADDLAYVMFTSGSTGTPKGVAVTHRNVAALVADRRFDEAQSRVLMHSSYAFDASTYEMWVPLLRGGTVVVAPPGDIDVESLETLVREYRVTSVWLTTALFNMVAEERPECLAGLREVWTGGEAVSRHAFQRVLESCPRLRLVNGYGPTETTTFATCMPVGAGDQLGVSVPIGHPMDNDRTYVLDAGLALAPVGVTGELYVGGLGVARGYLGRPGLSAERFVADPFAADGSRMYRTGDLVRWNADHRLEYQDRADLQVKLRGFRIELPEIENALVGLPGLGQVAVILREDRPGDKRLVAYAVPVNGAGPSLSQMQEHLASVLPRYMLPSAIVLLDAMPLNSNGKLDRQRLPEPEMGGESAGRAPRSPLEEVVCELFAAVLGAEVVTIDDSFFDVGGHSLLATRLVSRIRSACGVELSVRDVFEYPTVAELVSRFSAAAPARPALRRSLNRPTMPQETP